MARLCISGQPRVVEKEANCRPAAGALKLREVSLRLPQRVIGSAALTRMRMRAATAGVLPELGLGALTASLGRCTSTAVCARASLCTARRGAVPRLVPRYGCAFRPWRSAPSPLGFPCGCAVLGTAEALLPVSPPSVC